MKTNPLFTWLIPLILVLAAIASSIGLFYQDEGRSYLFVTMRGQTVQLDGRGLYRNDTLFSAAGFRGTDAVTLIVGIPLLVISFLLYRRASLRGGLLLAGALSYFLYIGASMTFSAAFNPLFLIYTGLFSASLFGFMYVLASFDLRILPEYIAPTLPRRGLATFLFVAGLGTLGLWLSDLIGPLWAGQPPALLGPYTTMYTHGFDSAVITPAAILTGIYLLRRGPLGYLLSLPVLVLCTLNGVVVLASTISQTLAGIVFPVGIYVGMIGSWVVMGAFAVWLTIAFFRNMREPDRDELTAFTVARA